MESATKTALYANASGGFWFSNETILGGIVNNVRRKLCGVSEPTVRRWSDKFREHLFQNKLLEIRLSGIVQMGEAYRGGKNKGFSIIAAKEERNNLGPRKIALKVIANPSVDRKETVDFLCQNVSPGSCLQTDGSTLYKGIHCWWSVKTFTSTITNGSSV